MSEERRRFQRVRVNLLGRYMLADRREFPCQVTDMSPGGMALIAPVAAAGRTRHRLCRPRRPARRQDRAPVPERLRDDRRGDAAQARQARRPAHMARQPPHARTCRKTAATAASRRRIRPARLILPNGVNIAVPRHRHFAVGRRRRDRPAARARRARHHWQERRAGSCAISKTASRSSSSGCSTRTFSKRTSPAGKRRAALAAARRADASGCRDHVLRTLAPRRARASVNGAARTHGGAAPSVRSVR